jgi:hypothetical protein
MLKVYGLYATSKKQKTNKTRQIHICFLPIEFDFIFFQKKIKFNIRFILVEWEKNMTWKTININCIALVFPKKKSYDHLWLLLIIMTMNYMAPFFKNHMIAYYNYLLLFSINIAIY